MYKNNADKVYDDSKLNKKENLVKKAVEKTVLETENKKLPPKKRLTKEELYEYLLKNREAEIFEKEIEVINAKNQNKLYLVQILDLQKHIAEMEQKEFLRDSNIELKKQQVNNIDRKCKKLKETYAEKYNMKKSFVIQPLTGELNLL